MGSIDHQDTMWSTIMPHLSLDYALTIMNTPPLASRRDHWNSKRPCGARLWGQDGHCHTKPSRGTSFNLFPLSMHWFIMSFRNIIFLSVRLFSKSANFLLTKFFFVNFDKVFVFLTKYFCLFVKYIYISGYLTICKFPFDEVASSSPTRSLHHIL